MKDSLNGFTIEHGMLLRRTPHSINSRLHFPICQGTGCHKVAVEEETNDGWRIFNAVKLYIRTSITHGLLDGPDGARTSGPGLLLTPLTFPIEMQ